MVTRFQDVPADIFGSREMQTLLRQLPVGVVVADAQSGRIVSANERAASLWHDSDGPETVDEWSSYVTGYRTDGREYGAEEWPLARALRDGEEVAGERIEVRARSGARLILEVSAAPVRDDTNEIRGAVSFLDDVTEQRQEERRRDFLMELTDEMRVIDDPIAIMEIAASATGEQLDVTSVSYGDIDIAGRTVLVHAEYRNGRMAPPGKYHLDEFGPKLLETLQQGETVVMEDVHADRRLTGDLFDLWGIQSAIAVPLIRRGRMAALFAVLHAVPRRWTRSDISLVQHIAERTCHAVETARVEADLRQSREWLTLALRAGSAAIWEWDLRTGEIRWSEEYAAVLGSQPARRALTFNRWLALVHPEDHEAARAAARRIAAMREGEIELEYRLADAGRWVTMRGRVIADKAGMPCRVVGVAVDTTERKATELERERLLREVSEASEAKSHFISVISHEFRTPLTAIIGYTELLSTGVSGSLTTRQERQLDRIRASAWHLTQMVDEILTFSRLEGGRETLSATPTDVPTLVREAVALMAPGAAAKGLGLACALPDEPITLFTDGVKLRQILLNLLSNAVKFTDNGGITLQVKRHAAHIEFAVADTGIGIREADLPHIFERFWQAEHGPTRVAAGAGLGLTVCLQLARLLDGELTVESEAGKGSTFRLALPITHSGTTTS